MAQSSSTAYNLVIRQQPEHAKVAVGKEKDRKPIDPPPIVQIKVDNNVRDQGDQPFLQSPYFFMSANLVKSDGGEIQQAAVSNANTCLAGTLVSSLHRLKDIDQSDGGFFVFFDLSVKLEGNYRLQFNLYEMRAATTLPDPSSVEASSDPLSQALLSHPREVGLITSITSNEFRVHAPRSWPGMGESTKLTRSFSEQGVKLRLRKEPRTLLRKRGPASDDYEPKSYRTKLGRSGDIGMQPQRRGSMQRSDLVGSALRRTDSPFQQRPAVEVFSSTQNNYRQPSRPSSHPNLSQRFETSDHSPLSPLQGQESPLAVPIHARMPSLPSSHQENSDMNSLSSAGVTRTEELGGNIPRRGLSNVQLRQANSDSSLRSQTHSQTTPGVAFTGMPENQYLSSNSLPGSNRASFSEYGGMYTHQPPTQTMHSSLQRTPQSYTPNYTQHSHSHSQTSLTSHSPATSRSTPQSFFSFGAGPRDPHTGMPSSALTSPFESPEAGRRDYGAWTGEGGEERVSLPGRGQDLNTAGAIPAPPPFYNPRHSGGNYGNYNAGRSIPISQAQGLGISGLYNSPSNYMPAPSLIPSHTNDLVPPRSSVMALGSDAPVETGQAVSSTAPENLESAVTGTGEDMRGRGGW